MSTISSISKGSAYITTDNLNCMYANLTAGTTKFLNPVTLYGIIVNSHTSGVVTIWDGITPQTTPMTGAISLPTAGSTVNLLGITSGTACTIEVAGTANITLAYRKVKEFDFSNNIA